MPRISSILLLPFAVLAGAAPSGAGEGYGGASAPATVALTLEAAERLALERNPHLRAAEERRQAAAREVVKTWAPADPVLMVGKLGQPGDPFNLSASTTEMWMVEQRLRFPGKSWVERGGRKAEVRRREALLDEERRLILLRTRNAYWDFVRYRGLLEIWKRAEQDWKSLSGHLRSRELSGQWLSLRTVRLQMESARAANELLRASQALRAAETALNYNLSLPHSTRYELAEEPPMPPFPWRREDILARALEFHPLLAVAREEVARLRAEKRSAILEHLPDFSVRIQGLRDPAGGGFSEYGVRFSANVPLFFPFRQTQEVKRAGDELSAAEADREGLEDEVVHRVEEAFVDAEAARRILELYEEGGLQKQAERAWRAAERAYRNEALDLAGLVEHYNLYLDVRKAFVDARADYGKALARLQYAAGLDANLSAAPAGGAAQSAKERNDGTR